MDKNQPLISVCIPCYNNSESVLALLESLSMQTFRDFEVIVSDNSANDDIKELANRFANDLEIRYFKNEANIGAVANWNRAIELANGDWIKVMHADDLFVGKHGLNSFAENTKKGANFIFSNYEILFSNSLERKKVIFPKKKLSSIYKLPMILNAENLIGNPSCTMFHSSLKHIQYDTRFIWKVDIDHYINLIINGARLLHIDKELIKVSINDDQITKLVKLNRKYEIPEAYYLLEKYGFLSLNNMTVYDSYWRTFRNLSVSNEAELTKYIASDWGLVVKHMLKNISRCNTKILKNRFYSKIKMFQAFLSRPKLK